MTAVGFFEASYFHGGQGSDCIAHTVGAEHPDGARGPIKPANGCGLHALIVDKHAHFNRDLPTALTFLMCFIFSETETKTKKVWMVGTLASG